MCGTGLDRTEIMRLAEIILVFGKRKNVIAIGGGEVADEVIR